MPKALTDSFRKSRACFHKIVINCRKARQTAQFLVDDAGKTGQLQSGLGFLLPRVPA